MDLLLESARRRMPGPSARPTSGPLPQATSRSSLRALGGLLVCFAVSFLAGCGARRSVLIETTPPGALIRLDDEVVGTTPLEYPFVHYGTRRVTLYLPGYRTWSEQIAIEPRWYARFPMDLITEVLLPLNLRDQRKVKVDLVADDGSESTGDADAFVERAQALRAADLALDVEAAEEELEGSADTNPEPKDQATDGAGPGRSGAGPR